MVSVFTKVLVLIQFFFCLFEAHSSASAEHTPNTRIILVQRSPFGSGKVSAVLSDEEAKNLFNKLAPFCQSEAEGNVILIFNEMFFGRTPLANEEYLKICKAYKESQLAQNPSLFTHMNFLFKKKPEKRITPKELTDFENLWRQKEKDGCVKTDKIFKFSTLENLDVYYLYNRCSVFHKGVEIAYYDKGTFCQEDKIDDIRDRKCIYAFGDGQDHVVNKSSLIAAKWIENVSTEICSDLFYGIRKKNGWMNGGHKTKIHIVTSNSIDIGDQPYVGNLPTDGCVIVCAVDPDGKIKDPGHILVDPKEGALWGELRASTMVCLPFQKESNTYLNIIRPKEIIESEGNNGHFKFYSSDHYINVAIFEVDNLPALVG